MTAASDRREELEGWLWQHVAPAFDDRRQGAAVVAKVLSLSDACVKAVRPPRAPKAVGPPKPKKPPAVHYNDGHGGAWCTPGDYLGGRGWAKTADRQAVTCERCLKALAQREAGEPS